MVQVSDLLLYLLVPFAPDYDNCSLCGRSHHPIQIHDFTVVSAQLQPF